VLQTTATTAVANTPCDRVGSKMYPAKTRVGDVVSNLPGPGEFQDPYWPGRGQHELNVHLRRKDVSLTSSPYFHDLEGYSGGQGDATRRSFCGFVQRVVAFRPTAAVCASRGQAGPDTWCAGAGEPYSGVSAIGVVRLLVDAGEGALTPLFQSAFSPQSTTVEVS